MDELDALWAFLLAAAIALAVTPLTARLARRLGVVHVPRERDLHDRTVPGLGGLAILVAAATAAIIFLPDGRETRGSWRARSPSSRSERWTTPARAACIRT